MAQSVFNLATNSKHDGRPAHRITQARDGMLPDGPNPEQTFEGRHESAEPGKQAFRSFAVFLEALNRHRGKGQQKVTVDTCTFFRAAKRLGAVGPGGGPHRRTRNKPMQSQLRMHQAAAAERGNDAGASAGLRQWRTDVAECTGTVGAAQLGPTPWHF